jgi:hypothetical protein
MPTICRAGAGQRLTSDQWATIKQRLLYCQSTKGDNYAEGCVGSFSVVDI